MYSSVVSRDSVRIALTIAVLNDLEILACDIQNAYLTAPCREKVWTITGTEFGPEDCGKTMLVVRALYGLKSLGAAFRSFLAETLYDMGYKPSGTDPDVWMRPAIKDSGFKYWEYILCYVDDVLSISHKPERALKGIASKFKLKDDKWKYLKCIWVHKSQECKTMTGTYVGPCRRTSIVTQWSRTLKIS